MLFGLKIPTVPSRSDSASSNVPGYTLLTQPEELEKGEAATDLLLDDHDEEPQYAGTSIASRACGRLMHLIKRIAPRFHYILPSFLHPRFYEPKKLRPTAWLDGLRGIAAFFVVIHHTSLLWFDWEIHKGWGTKSTADSWLGILVRLPIVRLVISGLPHVCIFFVISGYAISHRPLSLARQGRYADVGATLSSAVFRRHGRLFLPAAVVTLCSAVTAQLVRHWFADSGLSTAIPGRVIPMKSSMAEQLATWLNVEVWHTKPLRHGFAQMADGDAFNNPYDYNLWTLPIEFTSSMVVFVIIGAFTRLHNRARMAFVLAALVYVEYKFVLWAIFLFLGGMLICDLRLELDGCPTASCPPPPPPPPGPAAEGAGVGSATSRLWGHYGRRSVVLPLWARERRGNFQLLPPAAHRFLLRRSTVGYALGTAAFVAALFLLSTPEVIFGGKESSFGYGRLTAALDKPYDDHVLVPLGAVLLVLTVDHAPFLQGLFTNRPAQYLGRVSYSLYLVHGPLLWSLGIKLGQFMLSLTGWGTPFWYCAGVGLGVCVWLGVVFWVADLTNRYVDEPCVRLTRWVYNKLARKDE